MTQGHNKLHGNYWTDFNSWAFSDFLVQLEKWYQTVAGSAMLWSRLLRVLGGKIALDCAWLVQATLLNEKQRLLQAGVDNRCRLDDTGTFKTVRLIDARCHGERHAQLP